MSGLTRGSPTRWSTRNRASPTGWSCGSPVRNGRKRPSPPRWAPRLPSRGSPVPSTAMPPRRGRRCSCPRPCPYATWSGTRPHSPSLRACMPTVASMASTVSRPPRRHRGLGDTHHRVVRRLGAASRCVGAGQPVRPALPFRGAGQRWGGIFSFLPQAESTDEDTFEQVFGTPPTSDLALVARGFGLRVIDVAALNRSWSWGCRNGRPRDPGACPGARRERRPPSGDQRGGPSRAEVKAGEGVD